MVDVGDKAETHRIAIAEGRIRMGADTLGLILSGGHKKGDVLGIARVAGIMGAKRTADLIPLCHPLPLTGIDVQLKPGKGAIEISATVRTTAKTGVEMEALTGVSVAALTVYDMLKAVDRGMVLADLRLEEKRGGRSGTWRRPAGRG